MDWKYKNAAYALNESQHSTLLTFVKCVGFFKDTVYQVLLHCYSHSTKKSLYFNHLTFTPHQLCTKLNYLVLCCITVV